MTGESGKAKRDRVQRRLDDEFKKKRNGSDKIGREQTIVIKLSMKRLTEL